jgi:hypothetical protein
MKNGSSRSSRWFWWITITVVAAQLYIVQELAAALLLFSVVFAAFALLVGTVRLLQFTTERVYNWSASAVQDSFNRRSLRRLRSETAR